jgi:hypothetical protein
MSATSATNGLQAYKAWRLGLKLLPTGTILNWVVGYQAGTATDSIKSGTHFKILGAAQPFGYDGTNASMTYKMVLVSKTGREYKRIVCWSVENIARRIECGEVIC